MAIFLIVVGITSSFRVLGRHCMPILPILMFPLGLGLTAAWNWRGWVGKLTVTAFLLSSLASCLALRFDQRHAKDDYRGAAALAREAVTRGELVWWNADGTGATIYGLPLTKSRAQSAQAVLIEPPPKGFESGLAMPDLVVTSKPDVYDVHGYLADYLSRSGFVKVGSLPAFTIWRRRP